MPVPNPAALEFLRNRRSHPAKAFALPVPDRAALTELLTIASRVPDHGKLEPWRFVVIEAAAMARLADLAEARAAELGLDAEQTGKGRGQYDRGLLAVAVIFSPRPSPKVPEQEQLLSAGALCLGLVNAAEAAGWGANWLSGWPAHDPVFATRAFGTTPTERVAGIVHIGTVATDTPDRPRPDVTRLTTWAAP
jgi:nitroreductase